MYQLRERYRRAEAYTDALGHAVHYLSRNLAATDKIPEAVADLFPVMPAPKPARESPRGDPESDVCAPRRGYRRVAWQASGLDQHRSRELLDTEATYGGLLPGSGDNVTVIGSSSL